MKPLFKIATFFLLITVSIPLIFTLYFFVKKQVIQHEMKEKLEQSSLHTVLLMANKVQWTQAGKEVIIEGKMFDVDSYFIENGCYHFKGLFDDDETVLNKQLENYTKPANG